MLLLRFLSVLCNITYYSGVFEDSTVGLPICVFEGKNQAKKEMQLPSMLLHMKCINIQ